MQDLVTVNKINALVIFPYESASLTQPVAQVKKKGVYVTVVDRGLTDTSAQDAYVAGDNTAFGKIPAEYLAKALDGKGDIVALRGIPTTLDNERWTAFTGARVSCALPMEVPRPAKSKATETKTAVRLGPIHSPSVEFICFNERAPP